MLTGTGGCGGCGGSFLGATRERIVGVSCVGGKWLELTLPTHQTLRRSALPPRSLDDCHGRRAQPSRGRFHGRNGRADT
jgi:hypothetical protein